MLFAALLLIAMIAIVYFGLRVNGWNPVSVPFLFAAPFVVAIINGMTNFGSWGYGIHGTTFIVLGLTASVVLVASFVVHVVIERRRTCAIGCESSVRDVQLIEIPVWFYAICIAVSLVTIPLLYEAIKSIVISYNVSLGWTPDVDTGSILQVIKAYEEHSKFTDFDTSIRGVAGQLRIAVSAFAYFFMYVLINNFVNKSRKVEWLALAGVITTLPTFFLPGGRAGFINLVVSSFIMWILILARAGRKLVTRKRVIGVLICLVIAALLFQPALALLGRDASEFSAYEYLSIYCGAPLFNYDSYLSGTLSNPSIPTSVYWGEASFPNLRTSLSHWFGIDVSSHIARQPFQAVDGHSLGNVYTGLMSPTLDWGIAGPIFYYLIIGIICQLIFEWALDLRTRELCGRGISLFGADVPMLIYGYIGYQLLFSFFSNWIGESVVNTGFARMVIVWMAIDLLLRWVERPRGKHADSGNKWLPKHEKSKLRLSCPKRRSFRSAAGASLVTESFSKSSAVRSCWDATMIPEGAGGASDSTVVPARSSVRERCLGGACQLAAFAASRSQCVFSRAV